MLTVSQTVLNEKRITKLLNEHNYIVDKEYKKNGSFINNVLM